MALSGQYGMFSSVTDEVFSEHLFVIQPGSSTLILPYKCQSLGNYLLVHVFLLVLDYMHLI